MTSLPIPLPDGFTPLVSAGDIIKAKQPIAEKKSSAHTVTISIPEELGIPPQKAGKTIRKNPGDSLEPGDVIAVKAGFLGMGEQKVLSSVSGKILTYERRSGELTIAVGDDESTKTELYHSPVDGKVTLCDNDKIVVETEKDGIVTTLGYGTHVRGEIVVKPSKEGALPQHEITPDCIDKILVASHLDRDGLLKAIAIGCSGIIVKTFDEGDTTYFEERGSDIPLVQVPEEAFATILKWSGKQAFVDGESKSIVLLHI